MRTLSELLNTLPQKGRIEWIGVRPERRATMLSVEEVSVGCDTGLVGDRYQGRSGKRQVTLVQKEHFAVVASCCNLKTLSPNELRRNLVVSGINLLALKNKVISVGNIKLEVTGLCHPCSRMEETLGAGGYNAMRGHGGVTARILTDGDIKLGDRVEFCLEDSP